MSTRASLPIAARASWHPLSLFGFGIYGFINFNSEQSFAGAVLAIQLGLFRSGAFRVYRDASDLYESLDELGVLP